MKTEKPNTQVDIFSDAAVHDYVSGHMSKEHKVNFEEALANNKSLQGAVSAERRLRAALLKYEHDQQKPDAISDSGIDSLFATLDKLDQGAGENAQAQPTKRSWYAAAGIAASVMLAVALFIDQRPNSSSDQDYTLLSDADSSAEINFDDLVKAKKVAQIWLVKDLPEEELSKLFSEHNLKPIGRAGSAWIVASSHTLSDLALSDLKAEDKFEQVSLISFNQKTK